MIRLVLMVLALGTAAYFLPQVYEGTGNTCQALEKKLLRKRLSGDVANSVAADLTMTLSDGALGRQLAAREYPDLPEKAGCVVTYYNFPD